MNWIRCILSGIAGMALLYYGAEWLVKGGCGIARKCRVSPLVIGLTLVAFATSAPELVVSVISALEGYGDVSLGNVVGSNICNITVILGLSALIAPVAVHPGLLKLDMPLLAAASAALPAVVLATGGVGRIAAAAFLVCGLWYTVHQIRASRRENREAEELPAPETIRLWAAAVLVVIGLGALTLGARIFVDSAVFAARHLGISDAVIGLTIVALGTSLPELATSAVAAFKGEQDIAVGNVVGSNLMNILLILGVAPLIRPIAAPGIRGLDFAVMLGATFALWGLMYFRKRIGRGAGAAFLLAACAYTAYLILRNG